MFKHANTLFPGDKVRKAGEKTSGATEKVGRISGLINGMAEVRWSDGSESNEKISDLEVDPK